MRDALVVAEALQSSLSAAQPFLPAGDERVPRSEQLLQQALELLRDDGKPALLFTAHLGNWELPAVAAQRHGLPTAVVYRMPNNRVVADQIVAIRGPLMGRQRDALGEIGGHLVAMARHMANLPAGKPQASGHRQQQRGQEDDGQGEGRG